MLDRSARHARSAAHATAAASATGLKRCQIHMKDQHRLLQLRSLRWEATKLQKQVLIKEGSLTGRPLPLQPHSNASQ